MFSTLDWGHSQEQSIKDDKGNNEHKIVSSFIKHGNINKVVVAYWMNYQKMKVGYYIQVEDMIQQV
jgi:hypothetical protein